MALPSLLPRSARPSQGFTLLEVLMAVSVIVILMAIIIPAIGGAQTSAKRAKTRVQFSQWSAAIEQFRQEYGYYPSWGTGNSDPNFENGRIDTQAKTERFVQCLSGRKVDGSPYEAGDPGFLSGNAKHIAFCAFGAGDLTSDNRLQDAFGNTSIVVLLDRNLSGIISSSESPADFLSLPPVQPFDSGAPITIPPPPSPGIRAGVAFYSAGDGQTPVTSW